MYSKHTAYLGGELRNPISRHYRQCLSPPNQQYSHVSAQSDLVVREPAFGVHGPQCADAVDDEAVVLYWRLEALLSSPWLTRDQPCIICSMRRDLQVMLFRQASLFNGSSVKMTAKLTFG